MLEGMTLGSANLLGSVPYLKDLSFLYDRGGFIVLVLGGFSVLALAILIEKTIRFRLGSFEPPAPASEVAEAIRRQDSEQVQEYVEASPTVLGAVIDAAYRNRTVTQSTMKETLTAAAEGEIDRLENRLGFLDMTGRVAPLLGLTGTVMGMIQAMGSIQFGGASSPEVAAAVGQGIAEALYTTVAGLFVAVPCIVSYRWLAVKLGEISSRVERFGLEFVKELYEGQTPTPEPEQQGDEPETTSDGEPDPADDHPLRGALEETRS